MPGEKEKTITLAAPLSLKDLIDIAVQMDGEMSTYAEGYSIQRNHYEAIEQTDLLRFVHPEGFQAQSFTSVTRGNVSDDELVAALSLLEPEYKGFKEQIERGFNLPAFSERHQRLLDEREREKDRLYDIIDLLGLAYNEIADNKNLAPSKQNAVEVTQGFATVLDETASQEMLYTRGVGPCVVVMYRNPENNRIGMAHIASADNISLLDKMRDDVQGGTGVRLDAKVWGARQEWSELLAGLVLRHIGNDPDNVEFSSVAVCQPQRGKTNAIIFSRDGSTRMETDEEMNRLMPPEAGHIQA